MNVSAVAMMLFGILLLYGGLGVCLYVAWRCYRQRCPKPEDTSSG